jgi:hypothetical protein
VDLIFMRASTFEGVGVGVSGSSILPGETRMPASTYYDPSLAPRTCPMTAATTKKGTYLNSICERTLARNMKGIGIWIQANHLNENFLVFFLAYPKGRLSAKVKKNSIATRTVFEWKSI